MWFLIAELHITDSCSYFECWHRCVQHLAMGRSTPTSSCLVLVWQSRELQLSSPPCFCPTDGTGLELLHFSLFPFTWDCRPQLALFLASLHKGPVGLSSIQLPGIWAVTLGSLAAGCFGLAQALLTCHGIYGRGDWSCTPVSVASGIPGSRQEEKEPPTLWPNSHVPVRDAVTHIFVPHNGTFWTAVTLA